MTICLFENSQNLQNEYIASHHIASKTFPSGVNLENWILTHRTVSTCLQVTFPVSRLSFACRGRMILYDSQNFLSVLFYPNELIFQKLRVRYGGGGRLGIQGGHPSP